MIRLGTVWSVARAEMRLTRRLARYWVFQVVALLAAALFYLQYNFLHMFFSALSGSAAMINPRFLLSFVGMWYLMAFLLGLIFLGFEVRARDKRELIVEVFDSLPVSNLELLLGRFLGILIACWVPALISLGILSLIGILGFQSMPLPASIVAWLTMMAIPAYALILSLTFFMTFVLKHRLLAGVVIALVVIGLAVLNLGFTPIWFLPAVDLTGAFMIPPMSDFTPQFIDLRSFAQRFGYLLFAAAFLLLSAVIHPRKDDANRAVLGGVAAVCILGGLGLVGWLVQEGRNILADLERWRAVHEARATESFPDVRTVTGSVDISRKTSLSLDLELRLKAPENAGLESLLFTLNPGLEVTSVEDASGNALDFTTEEALLEIRLAAPLAPGAETTISLAAGGQPNLWYGYIDSSIQPLAIDMREGNLFALGFLNSLMEGGVVALLPGTRWFPISGPDVLRGGKGGRPVDFFDVDLTVQVPSGWLVAGPARRQEAGENRFRFATTAPIPDLALVASNFVSRTTEVEEITMEVLLHPRHTKNLEVFEEAGDTLREWIDERLSEAAEVGLTYPYDALTLVEVPNHLRGYSGGWRLDTTLTQPAMILTRESGFPTARFDRRFRDREDFEDHEEGIAGAMRDALTAFFENDFTGGNPFLAVARSYFGYQTRASGELAVPLDFVYEDLTNQLITEKRAYFSAHIMSSQSEMQQVFQSLAAQAGQPRQRAVSDIVIDTMTSRSDVWSTALDTSLAELNPWDAPKKSLNVLTLKGGAMARSLMDSLGTEKAGTMVANLRDRGQGADYDESDVAAVGEEIGVDLAGWMDRWMHDTALPGFIVVDTRLDRIRDDDDGSPNYQLLVTVYNGEPVDGMVKLEYFLPAEGRGPRTPQQSDPIAIPGHGAVEIGVVTSKPPSTAYLSPYLSLNRDAFVVNLPTVEEERIVERDPFAGSREVAWEQPADGGIVVDDLDEGFAVLEADSAGTRVAGRGVTGEDTDGGLPITTRRTPPRWSRRETPLAYGRYRHTVATIKAGDGDKSAQFTAEIPKSGLWELSYYVPTLRRSTGGDDANRRRRFSQGTWNLEIRDPSGSNTAKINADGADPGWNVLGEFEIAAGETAVIVSDRVDDEGRYVIADAIRWRPVSRGERAEARR